MGVTTMRFSDLNKLPPQEARSRFAEFGVSRRRGPNGEVDYLRGRVAYLEAKYEISSDQMRERVASGELQETADIANWLILLAMRDRLGERTK